MPGVRTENEYEQRGVAYLTPTMTLARPPASLGTLALARIASLAFFVPNSLNLACFESVWLLNFAIGIFLFSGIFLTFLSSLTWYTYSHFVCYRSYHMLIMLQRHDA